MERSIGNTEFYFIDTVNLSKHFRELMRYLSEAHFCKNQTKKHHHKNFTILFPHFSHFCCSKNAKILWFAEFEIQYVGFSLVVGSPYHVFVPLRRSLVPFPPPLPTHTHTHTQTHTQNLWENNWETIAYFAWSVAYCQKSPPSGQPPWENPDTALYGSGIDQPNCKFVSCYATCSLLWTRTIWIS